MSKKHGLHGTIKVINNKTGIIEQEIEMKSFVKAFIQILNMQIIQDAAGYMITDILDASRSEGNNSAMYRLTAPAGDQDFGIIVGTGITAVAVGDNKLATRIPHGVSAGQLSYGSMTQSTFSSDGTDATFTVSRPFTNSSGGTITIEETGLYTQSSTFSYMIERSLFNVVLADTDVKTIVYTIKVTV